MAEAFICEPYRTAVGRFGGQFRGVSAHELAAQLVRAVVNRTGIPREQIDDVIFAQCYPTMDAPALGRVVALDSGLPIDVAGLQIDRRCGSGLQAVIYAAMQVATGASEIVLAGGAESMSSAPFYSSKDRWGVEGASIEFHDALARGRVTAGGINYPVPDGMLETAENLRREYGIGLRMADMDLIELNEAFAAQVLACTREWKFGADDFIRMNVNGSAISLGHPLAATGVRIMTTLLREMDRRQARYGLETMCIGGGQGLAAVFERVSA